MFLKCYSGNMGYFLLSFQVPPQHFMLVISIREADTPFLVATRTMVWVSVPCVSIWAVGSAIRIGALRGRFLASLLRKTINLSFGRYGAPALFGGNSNNGLNVGSMYVNLNNGFGNSNWNIAGSKSYHKKNKKRVVSLMRYNVFLHMETINPTQNVC